MPQPLRKAPSGSTVQTQYFTFSSYVTGNTTNWTDMWSVTFTPKRAGNSIWQIVQWVDLWEASEHNLYRIVDDTSGSDIQLAWDAQQSSSTTGWASTNRSLNHLLTNCTLQTYTFRIQARGAGAQPRFWMNYSQSNSVGNTPSYWTIMEIEA